jgi:hypothetical protein
MFVYPSRQVEDPDYPFREMVYLQKMNRPAILVICPCRANPVLRQEYSTPGGTVFLPYGRTTPGSCTLRNPLRMERYHCKPTHACNRSPRTGGALSCRGSGSSPESGNILPHPRQVVVLCALLFLQRSCSIRSMFVSLFP